MCLGHLLIVAPLLNSLLLSICILVVHNYNLHIIMQKKNLFKYYFKCLKNVNSDYSSPSYDSDWLLSPWRKALSTPLSGAHAPASDTLFHLVMLNTQWKNIPNRTWPQPNQHMTNSTYSRFRVFHNYMHATTHGSYDRDISLYKGTWWLPCTRTSVINLFINIRWIFYTQLLELRLWMDK